MKNHTDENYKWNEGIIYKKKLRWGSLCFGNPYMIKTRDNRYLLHRNNGPCMHVPLFAILSNVAINNTILMMIVDYGYLDLWRNSNTAGNLSQYKNLIVFCLDEQSYKAVPFIYCHS